MRSGHLTVAAVERSAARLCDHEEIDVYVRPERSGSIDSDTRSSRERRFSTLHHFA